MKASTLFHLPYVVSGCIPHTHYGRIIFTLVSTSHQAKNAKSCQRDSWLSRTLCGGGRRCHHCGRLDYHSPFTIRYLLMYNSNGTATVARKTQPPRSSKWHKAEKNVEQLAAVSCVNSFCGTVCSWHRPRAHFEYPPRSTIQQTVYALCCANSSRRMHVQFIVSSKKCKWKIRK